MNLQEAVRRTEEMQTMGHLGNRVHALYGLLMQATAGDCKGEDSFSVSSSSSSSGKYLYIYLSVYSSIYLSLYRYTYLSIYLY